MSVFIVIFGILFLALGAFAVRYAFRLAYPKKRAESPPDPSTGRPMNPNCNLAMPLEECVIHSREGKVIDYACGHPDATEFKVDLYGEPALRKRKDMDPTHCADCLLAEVLKFVIRCGQCGYDIKPGDDVALYVDDKKIFTHPEWKTLVDEQVVGCMRWDCCPSGGFLAGRWTVSGYTPLFKHGSIVGEAMATGKVVTYTGSDD